MCFIFSLHAVVAADVDADDTNGTALATADADVVVKQSDNLSSLTLPANNEVLSAGEGSFTQLAGNLSGQTEVTLTKNYTYVNSDSEYQDGIPITESIKIIGSGNIVIDASHSARIFNIASGATVTLQGITFINGNSNGNGGAIVSQGVLNVTNCKFINNTANSGNGGGVFIQGSGSTITSSYFEGNRAINDGRDSIGAGGAVFIVSNNVKIVHTKFISNHAGLNGGAIASKDGITNCSIVNGTFERNTANGSAGAVGMQSTNFKMYNSTFRYNEAKGISPVTRYPGNGGAIVLRASNGYVYNCTFTNNIAKTDGGAVYLTNVTNGTVNNNTGFELCTFTSNTASTGNGGAINSVARTNYGYVINCNITNNEAYINGGAIYWVGTNGNITGSKFTHNIANRSGGAIFWIGDTGYLYNSIFRCQIVL